MSRKILALDLDGTLTDSNKEITPRTKEMIAKMQEQGHIVVLASGRHGTGVPDQWIGNMSFRGSGSAGHDAGQ